MATLSDTGLESLLSGLGLNTPVPPFQTANVLNKPLDIGRAYLADILAKLTQGDAAHVYNTIQWPNNISNGDFSIALPKLSHEVDGADPEDLGFELMQNFPQCPLFLLPFPDGALLRVMFLPKTLPRLIIPYIRDRASAYGSNASLGLRDTSLAEPDRLKVVVEFSSPNIAGEFQGKHLRSTIIGAFVANLYEYMGWQVTKVNYLGDWGLQIGLLGAGWDRFGSEEDFEKDPAAHLLQVYAKINDEFQHELARSKQARDEKKDAAEIAAIESQGLFAEREEFFKRMEEKDDKALELWKRFREVSIETFKSLYERLNVNFDEYSGESKASPELMAEIEALLKDKGIGEESNGAWIVNFKNYGLKCGSGTIRGKNGSSTYLLRDLAIVLDRARKYKFDKMIYVVAADHDTHFQRLFKIVELLGDHVPDLAGRKLQHLHFSHVSKMTEKLGRSHMLGEILDECERAMKSSLNDNPEKMAVLGDSDKVVAATGIGALVAQELSARQNGEHAFDICRMTSFGPGTGPEMQYCYAKLCSITAAGQSQAGPVELSDTDLASLESEAYSDVLRLLIEFPDVTAAAYNTSEAAPIITYLASLTSQLRSCFKDTGDAGSYSAGQVAALESTRQVFENGMRLLGLSPIQK